MKKFKPIKLDYMSFKELLINNVITNDKYYCFIAEYEIDSLNSYLSEYCYDFR